eukprot:21778-Eustigmatos_ZCMA.PRE.1
MSALCAARRARATTDTAPPDPCPSARTGPQSAYHRWAMRAEEGGELGDAWGWRREVQWLIR